MAQLFANNAYGVLAGTVNGAATLLVLVSGQGARFPAPTGGDHFLATLVGLDGNGAESVWEIVKCTGRITDQLTVVRAQEGTTATTWNAGTRIEVRWTKEGINGKETAGVAAAAVATHVGLADPHTQYATKASPTFTGTVSGITKAMVGLPNADDTSDAAKPISTAAQTALNAKAPLSGAGTSGTWPISITGNAATASAAPWSGISDKPTVIAAGADAAAARTAIGAGTSSLTLGTTAGTALAGNTAFGDVTLTGAQTLANKTLNAPIFNDGYTEEVFDVTGTTPALSPTNGSIQTLTLTGNATPTAGTWASGQSMTLMVDDGSAYTINWASMSITWKTGGGTAPTLNATGFTAIALWKVGTTIYGARVGDA